MLYSGVDLIRSSGLQQERLDRLNTADSPVRPVDPPDPQGALLRFARFVHKEGEKKRKPPHSETKTPSVVTATAASDPYARAESHRQTLFDRGHQIDVYI